MAKTKMQRCKCQNEKCDERATIDSGAQANVAKRLKCLTQLVETFNETNKSNINLETASGHNLNVIASGYINEMFSEVVISPDVTESLFSMEMLQQKGYWIIGPSTGGMIVLEPTLEDPNLAKVKIVTDKHFGFNINEHPEYPELIQLPNLTSIWERHHDMYRIGYRINLKARAIRSHGVDILTVKERVNLVQRTHMCSKNQLLFLCQYHVLIIDREECKKHFSWEPCYRMGIIQKNRTSNDERKDSSEKKAIDKYMEMKSTDEEYDESIQDVIQTDVRRLDPKHTTIGYQINSDIVPGPEGVCLLLSIDSSSGYGHLKTLNTVTGEKTSKSFAPDKFEEVITEYIDNGHHAYEYGIAIAVHQSDSEIIFKSQKMQDLLKKYKIEPAYSPVDHKEYNGTVEGRVRILGNHTASMFACANYASEVLWLPAIHQAMLLENLWRCLTPGREDICRTTAFTKEKPDLLKMILLPMFQACIVRIPEGSREGKTDRAVPAMYLRSTPGTDGSADFLSVESHRLISSDSFEIVQGNQSPWQQIPQLFFSDVEKNIMQPFLAAHKHHKTRQTTKASEKKSQERDFMQHAKVVNIPFSNKKDQLPLSTQVLEEETADATEEAIGDKPTAIDLEAPATSILSTKRSYSYTRHVLPQKVTKLNALRVSTRKRKAILTYDDNADVKLIQSDIKLRQIYGKPNKWVGIGPSIFGKGDGLFAKRRIPPKTDIDFYLGDKYIFRKTQDPHRSDFPDGDEYDTLFHDTYNNIVTHGNRKISYAPWANDPLDDTKCNCKVTAATSGTLTLTTQETEVLKKQELGLSYHEVYWNPVAEKQRKKTDKAPTVIKVRAIKKSKRSSIKKHDISPQESDNIRKQSDASVAYKQQYEDRSRVDTASIVIDININEQEDTGIQPFSLRRKTIKFLDNAVFDTKSTADYDHYQHDCAGFQILSQQKTVKSICISSQESDMTTPVDTVNHLLQVRTTLCGGTTKSQQKTIKSTSISSQESDMTTPVDTINHLLQVRTILCGGKTESQAKTIKYNSIPSQESDEISLMDARNAFINALERLNQKYEQIHTRAFNLADSLRNIYNCKDNKEVSEKFELQLQKENDIVTCQESDKQSDIDYQSDDEIEDIGYVDNNRFFPHTKFLDSANLESEITITQINMIKITKEQHKCDKQRNKRIEISTIRRMEKHKVCQLLKEFAQEEAELLDIEANNKQERKRKKRIRLMFELSELRKVKNMRVKRQLTSKEKKIRQVIKAKAQELKDSVLKDASADNPTLEQAMDRPDSLYFVNAIREHVKEMTKILKAAGHKKERPFDTPTINEARRRGDYALWAEAIKVEMDQMLTDDVHGEEIIGSLPPDANLVGSMWVLKIKRNRSTGAIEQYKARLVALGNQQDESSYDQIKSNTVRTSSVKLLISIQAITGALSMVLDVKGAYLKSVVDPNDNENLYIRYPDGKIYKLNKYLYGLKQAGFKWQQNVTGVLIKAGYIQSEADPMIFSKHEDKEFCIMSLHVDDFYVISSKQEMLNQLHEILTNAYGTVSIKSDDVMSYLGMEVKIEENGDIFLSQPAYIMSLAELLELTGKTNKTPMSVDAPYVHGDDTRIDQNYYLSLVGALNHLSQYSRPDILFAVSSVAQRCSAPTERDLTAVVRIFNYLRATPELGIRYNRNSEIILVGCVDASHNQYDDARGHYGYSFSLGRGNGSFDAKSTKMKLNTLSSTESEYVAFCEATREAVWLRRLLSDIGFPQPECTTIFEDNTSTIQLLEGTYNHKASKHVAPKFHYSRDIIANGEVCVEHKVTTEMEADMLTKPLATQTHWKFTKKLLNGQGDIYDEMIK